MRKIFFVLSMALLASCGSAKYTYYFDTGKQLDFDTGKWVLNRSQSNSKIFDSKLYENSKKQFKEILGDSLLKIDDLRTSKLVAPKLKFDLSASDLLQLQRDTDCDYLINIQGNSISDGAGTLTFSDQENNSSNRASVSIAIYDLNAGLLISSSQVYGKTTVKNSIWEDDKGSPTINPSSHMIMLTGARKLIGKYKKNRLD